MALDRWIALIFVAFCCAYGYAAFFTMDQLLPPFMQRNPVWPSTFPKVLSVLGVIVGLIVLFGLEKTEEKDAQPSATAINYRRLTDYNLGQALLLLALMVAYALLLRPIGFLAATTMFISSAAPFWASGVGCCPRTCQRPAATRTRTALWRAVDWPSD